MRPQTLLLLLLLACAAVLRGWDLRAPFDGEFEGFQGGAWGIAARNQVEHGAERVGFFPTLNPNLPEGFQAANLEIYTNHPATHHALNVLVARGLGLREWALRLPYLLGALALVALVFLLGQRVFGTMGAVFAALLAATSPGLAFYGAMVNYEDLLLPALLVIVWVHVAWWEKGRVWHAFPFAAAVAVAVSIDWPAAFLVPGLVLERLLPRGDLSRFIRVRSAFFSGLAGTVGIAAAVALHLFLVRTNYELLGLAMPTGEQGAGLAGALERLRNLFGFLFEPGGAGRWLQAQAHHVRALVSYELAALAALGLIVLLLSRDRRSQRVRSVVLPGTIGGLAYVVAFAKHSLDQTVFWLYVLPFLALASGHLLAKPCRLVSARPALQRVTACAVAALLAWPGVTGWKELRDSHREHVETRAIGERLAAATARRTVLYYPRSAGWNAAYAFYADRHIVEIVPATADLVAPVDALRDLELPPAQHLALKQHAGVLFRYGLAHHRPAVVLYDAGPPWVVAECAEIEREVRRVARVREQRLEGGLRLLWVEPQDYFGLGLSLNGLHETPELREPMLASLRAVAAAADDVRVFYSPQRLGLEVSPGPLLLEGRRHYFLPRDPSQAGTLLTPLSNSPHGEELEALGSPKRALVLRVDEGEMAAALRAAVPELGPFQARDTHLVCRLPRPLR